MQNIAGGAVRDRLELASVTLEVDLQTADMATVASWVKGVERVGPRTVVVSGAGERSDGRAIHDAFVAVTYITRQAGGR
jgi:D-amino peptidase